MACCDIRASFVVVQRWGFCMSVLQHRLLNGWPLFFMIALFSALIMTIGIWLIGVATVEEILALLRLSVQISAPWIYITFIASSLVRLYPNKTSRWVLRVILAFHLRRQWAGRCCLSSYYFRPICLITWRCSITRATLFCASPPISFYLP